MRARYEAQIKQLETWSGNEYAAALNRALANHRGMDFFTDEQLEEIRAEMIKREWFRHKLNRENRKRLASNGKAA